MEEIELRQLLSANIKRFRKRREWSQIRLAEKLDISANFLADIETGKSWVSPLTLVKLANTLDIEVFELFRPEEYAGGDVQEVVNRFAKDLSIALGRSVNQSVENVRKQHIQKTEGGGEKI
jgi:transcriptional regulator with XRE-family HTH domain